MLATIGVAVFLASLVTFLVLWWKQERILFQPPAVYVPGPEPSVARLAYHASDAQALQAYLVGLPQPAAPLVLAFHGNADVAEWLVPWARELHARTGASVFLPEYRGYSGLSGRPTYTASQTDARAALRYVEDELRVARHQLVFFGHSLGSAVAAELAVAVPPAALVLQSPFTSARAMAARVLVPPLPGFWARVSRVHFDTSSCVRHISVPVFVAHGARDRIVPASMARAVHESARIPGEFLVVSNAGHNNVPEMGQQAYWTWISHAVALAATTE
ncbi:MAG: alpha/beta hydrolase [Gemmatimonadaceae bacterium]